MKWFAEFNKNIRTTIAVISFLVFLFYLIFFELDLLALVFFFVAMFFCINVIIIENQEYKDKKYEELQQQEAKKRIRELQQRINNQSSESIAKDHTFRKFHSDIIEFPIYTKARGVTFKGRQELLQQANDGDELVLIHKPTEKYPETIVIINKETYDIIGNVSADLAWQLIDEFGEGCKFYGEIVEITGGYSGKNYGCNLTIDGVEY